MSNLTQLFLVSYTLVQDLLPLKLSSKNKYLLLTKLATICLAILVLLIQFAILLPFAMFRLCLAVTLRLSYGELYGGFLTGLDCLFETSPKKTVINVIQIYSSRDGLSVTLANFQESFSKVHGCSYKFSSSIHKILGYCFYVKDQVKFEDVVNIVRYNQDEYITRDMLFDYLHKNCLTLKKNQMWNVTFFAQPIKWNGNYNKDGNRQYVVICTLRHSLCDGPALVTLFRKYVLQEKPQDLETKVNVKVKRRMVNLDNIMMRRNPLTTKYDGLALKIGGNEDWQIASFFEEKSKYVPIIKQIKDKLSVKFSEVIGAAISASINDYVKQRNVTLDNFSIGSVIRLKIDDLVKLQRGIYTFEDINNNFGFIALSLPSNIKGRSMRNIIECLHSYNESLRYATDPLVAYLFLRYICTYLPIKFTKYCCEPFMSNMTIGMTNLIGFEKGTLKGYQADDIFFFVPGFLNTGFIFNIFSYDGRLQVTLTSREGFVHNKEELQEILNNTLKYIAKAEREILSSSTL